MAGDLRRHRVHYDIIVMTYPIATERHMYASVSQATIASDTCLPLDGRQVFIGTKAYLLLFGPYQQMSNVGNLNQNIIVFVKWKYRFQNGRHFVSSRNLNIRGGC